MLNLLFVSAVDLMGLPTVPKPIHLLNTFCILILYIYRQNQLFRKRDATYMLVLLEVISPYIFLQKKKKC